MKEFQGRKKEKIKEFLGGVGAFKIIKKPFSIIICKTLFKKRNELNNMLEIQQNHKQNR